MNQRVSVSKFGGTSLADFEAIRRSADIVAGDAETRIVTVSATSGTTNSLVTLSRNDPDPAGKMSILDELKVRHANIISHFDHPETIEPRLKELFDYLHELAISNKSTISPAQRDDILSHGELISSLIFTQALQEAGVDAVWQDARQVIRTDSSWGNAEPDFALIQNRIQSQWIPLIKNQVIVTQGFIGSDTEGHTTTFGRGGSDYSAAIIAEAAGAVSLKIWTDVPAIYTTDPRLVPEAHPIEEISFAEAAELATFGGKILHPATLLPAVRSGIPVYIGSSFQPERKGTWVVERTKSDPLVRAVTVRRKQTLLTLQSLNMFHRYGFLARVFSILARYRMSIDLITTSEVSVSLTIDNLEYATGKATLPTEMVEELRGFCTLNVEKDLSLVALIGNHMQSTKGLSGRLFHELGDFNVRLICHGASSHNLCFLVSEKEATQVAVKIHSVFLNQPEPSMAETSNQTYSR